MSLSMGMSLQLRQSPRLEQRQSLEHRQKLEARLEQTLTIHQSLALTLEQYLAQEDLVTGLYKKALKEDRVGLYKGHGMEFEVACVSVEELPERLRRYGMAFSHCLYNVFDEFIGGTKYALSRGSWLLFVVYDMHPGTTTDYLGYAAVHERGEQVTLGDHNRASLLEFAVARAEKKLKAYMRWLEKHCPEKFADVFEYHTHLDFPDDAGFRAAVEAMAETDEARAVLDLIERFEWPISLLRKLEAYKKRGDEIAGVVSRALTVAEMAVDDLGGTVAERVAKLRELIREGLRPLKASGHIRYANTSRNQELWREQWRRVSQAFQKRLVARSRAIDQSAYVDELGAAGAEQGMPTDGVLSPHLEEVLRSL